jgi:Trypsin
MRPTYLLFGVISALDAAACVDEPSFGSSDQAIHNGVAVDPAWRDSRYLVTVAQGRCSGVLLSNTLVLTAGHCVDETINGAPLNGLPPNMAYLEYGGDYRLSTRIYRFGAGRDIGRDTMEGNGAGFDGIGADLALLETSADPFEVNGSTTGFGMVVEPTTAAELEWQTLDLYGQGWDAGAPAPYNEPNGWRHGEMQVIPTSFVVDDLIHMDMTSTVQSVQHGDSGGPSFLEDENGTRLIGIHSRGWLGTQCALTYDGNDEALCDDFDQLVYPDLGGITLAMDPAWDNTKATEVLDVYPAELHVMREPDFDVNATSWTAMARVSTKLCKNRMFIGGHANGHQYQSKHGATCSSDRGGIAIEARYDMVSPYGLYDLDQTEWAEAELVALNVCRQLAGSGSGYWSGFSERGNSYGLICLQPGTFQNFTATWAQLNATGWRVDGTLQTPYAQALRAAHGFCTARGFATGYLRGTQTRDTYGVTCQRARP